MRHLTEDQFEMIMQGQEIAGGHLETCADCQAVLAEKKAIAGRLRQAFENISVPEALAQKIRQQMKPSAPKIVSLPERKRSWSARLSAAAAIILVVLVVFVTVPPNTASALADIHTHNMDCGEHEMWGNTDPTEMADYYEHELGVHTQLPGMNQGYKLCRCCIKKCLRKDVIGTYMVGTDQGAVTVAVLKAIPDGFEPGQVTGFYQGGKGPCRMVATEIDGQVYCAVGQIDYTDLQMVLEQLQP